MKGEGRQTDYSCMQWLHVRNYKPTVGWKFWETEEFAF